MAKPQSRTLDTTGLYCPEPVMLLHNAIRDMAVGECVEVIATDPATARDIPKFCHFLGHTLISAEQIGSEFRYLVEKCDDEDA